LEQQVQLVKQDQHQTRVQLAEQVQLVQQAGLVLLVNQAQRQ
jgi:hypothetical protein